MLDFCDADSRLSAADVVVAADVLYFPASGTMLARRVREALESGSRVIVGDSPDQPGRAAFIEQLDALLPDVGVAERWVRALGGDRGEPMLGPLDGPPARAHLRQRLAKSVVGEYYKYLIPPLLHRQSQSAIRYSAI